VLIIIIIIIIIITGGGDSCSRTASDIYNTLNSVFRSLFNDDVSIQTT
jgi:hypothetical protein